MRMTPATVAFMALVSVLQPVTIRSQDRGASSSESLSTAQIVQQIEQRNHSQIQRLKHYEALRHYEVEYRGFSKRIAARMDVEATYDAASGKSFRIISQTGSKLLCDKVLKQALSSEKEASQDPAATALTGANYTFQPAGRENLEGRPVYLLNVAPLKPNRFLYRGKIWVDAAGFAVVKIEAEPAKNPSFWISRTSIRSINAETDGFWLPQHTRSETKVRIGGTAVLTIDYGTYRIVSTDVPAAPAFSVAHSPLLRLNPRGR